MLQAPTEEEYQHAVLSLENRNAQCEEHRMGGWICQTGVQNFKVRISIASVLVQL